MSLVDYELLLAEEEEDFRDVPVPEWGGDVRIRRLNADDWVTFVELLSSADTDQDGMFKSKTEMIAFGVNLLARTITGADGQLVLNSDRGRKKLERDPFVLTTLLREAMDLNRLSKDVEQRIDDAKKN